MIAGQERFKYILKSLEEISWKEVKPIEIIENFIRLKSEEVRQKRLLYTGINRF